MKWTSESESGTQYCILNRSQTSTTTNCAFFSPVWIPLLSSVVLRRCRLSAGRKKKATQKGVHKTMRLADSWGQLVLTLSCSLGKATEHVASSAALSHSRGSSDRGWGAAARSSGRGGDGDPVSRSAVSAIITNCRLNKQDWSTRARRSVDSPAL